MYDRLLKLKYRTIQIDQLKRIWIKFKISACFKTNHAFLTTYYSLQIYNSSENYLPKKHCRTENSDLPGISSRGRTGGLTPGSNPWWRHNRKSRSPGIRLKRHQMLIKCRTNLLMWKGSSIPKMRLNSLIKQFLCLLFFKLLVVGMHICLK